MNTVTQVSALQYFKLIACATFNNCFRRSSLSMLVAKTCPHLCGYMQTHTIDRRAFRAGRPWEPTMHTHVLRNMIYAYIDRSFGKPLPTCRLSWIRLPSSWPDRTTARPLAYLLWHSAAACGSSAESHFHLAAQLSLIKVSEHC